MNKFYKTKNNPHENYINGAFHFTVTKLFFHAVNTGHIFFFFYCQCFLLQKISQSDKNKKKNGTTGTAEKPTIGALRMRGKTSKMTAS